MKDFIVSLGIVTFLALGACLSISGLYSAVTKSNKCTYYSLEKGYPKARFTNNRCYGVTDHKSQFLYEEK